MRIMVALMSTHWYTLFYVMTRLTEWLVLVGLKHGHELRNTTVLHGQVDFQGQIRLYFEK